MLKISETTNHEFMLKILELKLSKKLKSFKNERYIILTKGSILLGIKRVIKITNFERRFISCRDYQHYEDYIFDIWIDNSISAEDRMSLIEIF